jgi:hypothetical protein
MKPRLLGLTCFACGRPLRGPPALADTRDDQIVYLGPECARWVRQADDEGYQPPLGGPRLFPLDPDRYAR